MQNFSIYSIFNKFRHILVKNKEDNKLFTLWISDNCELPQLQQLSLKSMLLTGHDVTLYVYENMLNVPEGIKVADANKILDESKIFKYKEGFNKGSYSGFANWFRAKCLYERGTAWFDCDIIAIKNITEMNVNGPLISSQINPDFKISPNNAFLRLNKGDKLLKEMLDYMEEVKDNVMHGDTGPNLLKSMIDEKFCKYSDYLSSTDFIASINYFDYMDFLKPSKDMVPLLNFEDIWGFHIWNAMFRENGFANEKSSNSFYYDLKEAILSSFTKEDYQKKVSDIITTNG
jgi:hypothetical protein